MPRSEPDAPLAAVFLSPLTVVHGANNRLAAVTMKVVTVGETAIMTLSYPSKAEAKAARNVLLEASNAYSVPNAALWRALAESIIGLSLKVQQLGP